MSKEIVERSASSQITHVFLPDSSSTTGGGLTGLIHSSSGLKVNAIRPGESSVTTFTLETITTIGTYQAPTSNAHCRFKEIDSTNLPGMYELHFHNDWYNDTSSRRSIVALVLGATNLAPTPLQIQLSDPNRGVGSPAALPDAAAEASGGLFTRGSGAGQINQSVNGQIDTNTVAMAADVITADKIADDTFSSEHFASDCFVADNFAADVTTEFQNGLATSTDLAIVDTNVDTLLVRLSSARATKLDTLPGSGTVATTTDIAAITQASRVRIALPPQMVIPGSGNEDYRVWIYTYNEKHEPEDMDSNPTVAVENHSGTDRSGNLGTVTKPGSTTGQYYVDYNVESTDAEEGLHFKVDVTEGGNMGRYGNSTYVVSEATGASGFTSGDRTKLDAVHGKLPSKTYLAGSANSDGDIQLDEATGITNFSSLSVDSNGRLSVSSVGANAVTGPNDFKADLTATDALITTVDTVVDAIKVVTDLFSFTGNDVKATLDSEAVTLAAITHIGAVIPTVSVLTGHTAQTGDSFAIVNGASGNIAIKTALDTLKGDWDDGGRLDLILDACKDLLEADYDVDTTTTPWKLKVKKKGTATVLLSKDIKTPTGTNVTATTDVPGELTEDS